MVLDIYLYSESELNVVGLFITCRVLSVLNVTEPQVQWAVGPRVTFWTPGEIKTEPITGNYMRKLDP